MKFTEAVAINIAYPYIRKVDMPLCFGEPFELSYIAPMGYREGYRVELRWIFMTYFHDNREANACKPEIIRELNRVVYGEFINELRTARSLIKYGNEEKGLQMIDDIIDHILTANKD